MLRQIGANAGQTVDISISKLTADSLGVGVSDNQFDSLSEIEVTNADKAKDTLSVVDAAIDEITNIRGTLGAFQANTLESTANNMRTTLENTVSAESVIRDTDFAVETSQLTRNQIVEQASITVLSQANQRPQSALQLLG